MLNPDAKADGFGCAAGASPPILNQPKLDDGAGLTTGVSETTALFILNPPKADY